MCKEIVAFCNEANFHDNITDYWLFGLITMMVLLLDKQVGRKHLTQGTVNI